MAWKHDGKIAAQFPWGAVNYDVVKIVYADGTHPYTADGDESNAINKVYYFPDGLDPSTVTTANLSNYLIWHRYWEEQKKLLAGTQSVCIEYVSSGENAADLPLTAAAIYTADDEQSTTVNFGIIHESGLVVYKAVADTIDYSVSPKYDLAGALRKIQSISNVTLKKGLKYYIHYTNTNNTFKPAYFENTSGCYVDWTHSTLQNKSVADINSVDKYLGVVTDATVWLAANENDFMISEIGQGGLNNSDAYIRNNVCNDAVIIGQNQQTLPASEKDKLLKLNVGDGFMYIGNNYTETSQQAVLENQKIYSKNSTLDNTKYKGIKTSLEDLLTDLSKNDYAIYSGNTVASVIQDNHIYKKKADLDVDDDYTPSGDDNAITRQIIKLSYNANGNKHIAVNGSWLYADRTGNVYQLKSGYTYDFNNDNGYAAGNITTATTDCIYYISQDGYCPLTGNHQNAGMYCWNGSSFVSMNYDYNNVTPYFNITTIVDAVEEIYINGAVTLVGQLSDLAKTHYDGNYISNTIRSQTVQSDKKFYLELNGREV